MPIVVHPHHTDRIMPGTFSTSVRDRLDGSGTTARVGRPVVFFGVMAESSVILFLFGGRSAGWSILVVSSRHIRSIA
jgi:hypothetical protein